MQKPLLDAFLMGTVDKATYDSKSNGLKAEAAKVDESAAKLGGVDPKAALDLFDWTQNAGGILARFNFQCQMGDP